MFHVSNRRSSVLTPAEELNYYAGAGVNPSDSTGVSVSTCYCNAQVTL